jgi:tRNA G18 (ribose-2'-O)-methylase SpoU
MPPIPIDTLNDPRLEVFRDVKATRSRRWQQHFIAEGARLVKRLLRSDFQVESLLVSAGRETEFAAWLPPDVPMFVLPRPQAAELVGYNFHCGAMACARRKPNPSLEEIMARGGEWMTFVVCPDVNDPENIGTLIRLGAAFGIDALVLGPQCADPFSRRVLRVSMGNALTLPIVRSSDLSSDLRRLKAEWQVQLAATVVPSDDPTDDAVASRRGSADAVVESLRWAARPSRLALLFGNEANGLDRKWLDICDRRLTIPMHGADSLNVAVAAGIFLHHFTECCSAQPNRTC